MAGDEPSVMSKAVSGGGCGCGCLGGLVGLLGALVMLGVPLEFYDPTAAGWFFSIGVGVVVTGLLMAVGGVLAYIAGYLFVP